ncbi:MAG: alpha/beta fold hydrolase [Mizugakiibacter sp.]|uniref:alpha/beta fold hydrolase n=1 Tax=Mizugakiibacter sp. TaxID=1972610 RepID=UPI0031BC3F30|nr:alpha/beta fold hydrolase [Xanthomonadaceae bacterium]
MNAAVRQKSTIVRKSIALTALRAGYALGGRLAPRRTADRAARMFATPFAASRSRAQAARPDAEMRYAELPVAGEFVATYAWGDPAAQPYALLAHGWSSFGLRFLPWVAALRARGYAVVAFDQPGHGRSSGCLCTLPEFADTVRAVGGHYGDAALAIGHSLGATALAFAQGEAWRAARLVLIAPPADMLAAAGRFMRHVRLAGHLREPFLGWLKRRTGVDARDLQIHRLLPAFGQPGLVVHDLDDGEVPWEEGERYARHWPGARLLSTSGLGHNRIVDDPDVVDAVLRFLDGEAVGERVVSSPNLPYGVA